MTLLISFMTVVYMDIQLAFVFLPIHSNLLFNFEGKRTVIELK